MCERGCVTWFMCVYECRCIAWVWRNVYECVVRVWVSVCTSVLRGRVWVSVSTNLCYVGE